MNVKIDVCQVVAKSHKAYNGKPKQPGMIRMRTRGFTMTSLYERFTTLFRNLSVPTAPMDSHGYIG